MNDNELTQEDKERIIELADNLFPPAVPAFQMRRFAFEDGAKYATKYEREQTRNTALAFAQYMELESINHDFREQHTHSLDEHYENFLQFTKP